jgi:uncharacterized protein (TIGR02284 family)
MKPGEIVHSLKELIEISQDGQRSFEFCASHAEAEIFRKFFEARARQLGSEVGELQVLLTEQGGKPVLHGTAIGAVHRGWIRLKDTLGGTNDPDLLEECERGETQALKRRRASAAQEHLPENVRATAARHADSAQNWLDQARRLRSEMRAAA